MIEIRELVIRANVENTSRNDEQGEQAQVNTESNRNKGICAENIDLMLQIIKDKKER
jgi:hypothetical protein